VRVVSAPTPSVPPASSAEVAADDGDDEAEDRRLREAREEVAEEHGLESALHEERGEIPYSSVADTIGAQRAQRVGEDAERKGITIIAATTRGRTSFFAGSAPSARMASTCSVTFIAPDLGGHAAADASADDDGGERGPELAREREDDDARDVLDAAEARRPKANWMVMTIPMKIDVTATMPIERTPSDSIW
jgi:hypothetical protein